MTNFSRLFFVSILLLSAACAAKRVELPLSEERGLDAVLLERAAIGRIDAVMDVVFEKTDSEMRGSAVLDITKDGDLHLKAYSLGILAMDLTSKNGVAKSSPRLDRSRTTILTSGLRDSLFWWDIRDCSVIEEGEQLVLQNQTRTVWLDRKTLLPRKQKISFDDGKQLMVTYDLPSREGGVWYQSRMRIELARYAVTLTMREVKFGR